MLPTALSGICFAIVSVILLYLAYKTARFIDLYFLVPKNPLEKYEPSSKDVTGKSWALITGSSGGIGFGYAKYLLSLDFGVILVADRGIVQAESKLKEIYPNADVRGFTLDCMTATVKDIKDLVRQISLLPVTILINNVGGVSVTAAPTYRECKDFLSEDINNHLKLNAAFGTHLTREMLSLFLSNNRSHRLHSLILHTSSSARMGVPYLSLYSATKGYVTSFSHSLTRECRSFGYPIDNLLIVPGDVKSDSNTVAMAQGSPLADDFAKCVLERVDKAVSRGMLEISPFWMHAVQNIVAEWIPESRLRGELVKKIQAKRDAIAKAE